MVLKRSESLLSVSLDAFWVVPIPIILKFPDGRLFSSSVLNTWVLRLFPGSEQTAGLALTTLPAAMEDSAFFALLRAPTSPAPQIRAISLKGRGLLSFFLVFVSLFFILLVLSLWDWRKDQQFMLAFSLACLRGRPGERTFFPTAGAQHSELLLQGFPEGWREERGKRGKKLFNPFSFALSDTDTVDAEACTLDQTLNSQSQLYSYAAWRWHHWGALLGTITQLGEGFPCEGGKEWDYCLLNVSFCF